MVNCQVGPSSREVLDAARLCIALYGRRPLAEGWRVLTVADLGLPSNFAGEATRFVNRNAGAFVRETVVDGRRTLAIVFRGSDPSCFADWADNVIDINRHYRLMAPLVDAVGAYVRANGIERVLVAGHSLGASMVEMFLASHPDAGGVSYAGCAFGSPGVRLPAGATPEPRLLGIRHEEDAIPRLGTLRPKYPYGTRGRTMIVHDLGRHEGILGPATSHRMVDYLDTVEWLDRAALLAPALAPDAARTIEIDTRCPPGEVAAWVPEAHSNPADGPGIRI